MINRLSSDELLCLVSWAEADLETLCSHKWNVCNLLQHNSVRSFQINEFQHLYNS